MEAVTSHGGRQARQSGLCNYNLRGVRDSGHHTCIGELTLVLDTSAQQEAYSSARLYTYFTRFHSNKHVASDREQLFRIRAHN